MDNGTRCFCWCKDTNFSANHNVYVARVTHDPVVFAGAKILIFQQITTGASQPFSLRMLFLLVQRY